MLKKVRRPGAHSTLMGQSDLVLEEHRELKKAAKRHGSLLNPPDQEAGALRGPSDASPTTAL